ncbi:hypothetical protein J3D46_003369 [Paenarthrobacter sp. A20]|nr:hypothetical protein [Paenarthrobacter sp. A20]
MARREDFLGPGQVARTLTLQPDAAGDVTATLRTGANGGIHHLAVSRNSDDGGSHFTVAAAVVRACFRTWLKLCL